MSTNAAEAAPVRRGVTIAICFLVAALEGYDLQVISSAGPHLQRIMHLTPDQVGWFFSASLIGLAFGAIAGGWLADRYGRKPILAGSVAFLGIFTLATAFATNFESLLTIRILAGVGLGGAIPTLIALVAEVSGGRNTTSAVTTMISGQPTGGVISALIGRTVAESYGWESLFIIGGVLTLLVVPVLIWGLPETKRPQTAAPKMPMTQALFAERRTSGTVLLWITFILTLALLSTLLSWTPLLITGKGLPRPIGLNAVIALNVGGIIGALMISRMIDRFGVRWPMAAVYLLMGVTLYLFAHTDNVTMLMIVAGLVGFTVLGAQFSLYGVAPRLYPLAGRGSGVGVAVAMGRIGSVLGPIVIGRLIAGGANQDQAILVMAPVAVAAGLALIAMTYVTGGALARGSAETSH